MENFQNFLTNLNFICAHRSTDCDLIVKQNEIWNYNFGFYVQEGRENDNKFQHVATFLFM